MECVRVFTVLISVLICHGSAGSRRQILQWAVDDDGCRTPDKGVGYCKAISTCQPMLDFLDQNTEFTEAENRALAQYRCGFSEKEAKVCCPNKAITLDWVVDSDGCRTPARGVGDCIALDKCKSLLNIIDSLAETPDDEISSSLKKYACGFDNRGNVKVCCPRKAEELDTLVNRFGMDHSTHPNINLLPAQCGQSITLNRITNGNLTDLFEFPWAAVFEYEKEHNKWSCGGALINDRYVLTAAHCIRSKFKLLSVRLGEYDLRNTTDCIMFGDENICAPPVQDFEISTADAIVHPQYDSSTQTNDIALVRLRRPANITVDSVAPVCLPTTRQLKTHNYQNYTVIGWGATETGFSSPVLLKVLVPKRENSKCAAMYGKIPVTEKHICAGGKNAQDSCAGDSGGPLTGDFTSETSTVVVQYGIVSLGPVICGREEFPALYTKISEYMGWILDTIKP